MKNKEILAQIEKIKAEIEQRREENEDLEEKKKKELGAEVQNKFMNLLKIRQNPKWATKVLLNLSKLAIRR